MTDLFTREQYVFTQRGPKKDQTVIDQYMTPPEYCRARKASAYLIKTAMDTGKIESFLINGRVKIKTEEADKYLEERALKKAAF